MKKNIIVLLTILCILIFFAACDTTDTDQTDTAESPSPSPVSTSAADSESEATVSLVDSIELDETTADAENTAWILTDNFASRVNLRSSPEIVGDNILGQIYDREPVVVLESPISNDDAEWANIEYDGEEGYVSLDYITEEEPASILDSFADGIYLNDYLTDETQLTQLVKVEDVAPTVVIDLTLADEENFISEYAAENDYGSIGALYDYEIAMIQKTTGNKLAAAAAIIKAAGYELVLWDAYRPYFVTLQMYEIVDDASLVADPELGSKHNRGAAVDVTLYKDGQPAAMPTDDRVMGDEAKTSNYTDNELLTLLTDAMLEAGFETYSEEWWHFNDTNWEAYPVMNFDLALFNEDLGLYIEDD